MKMKAEVIDNNLNATVQIEMRLTEYAHIMFMLQQFQHDHKGNMLPYMEEELFEIVNEWARIWKEL